MLRKLSQRLTYANVMATLGVFIALGGSAYAVNTVNSTDIVDGQVKSVDVGNNEIGSSDVKDNPINTFDVHSFLGVDVVDGTLTGADIANASLTGSDIGIRSIDFDDIANNAIDSSHVLNNILNDEDIGQIVLVDFLGSIGVVPAASCVYRDVSGPAGLGGDHLVLTPNTTDASPGLSYTAEYQPTGANSMRIKVCNPTHANIDDGNTHFNLLVIDAQ